jgi:epoxyqueuosine reductase
VANKESLEEAIKSEASRLGFAACGFTRADASEAAGLDLERWLEAGNHGTMGWMASRAHQRVSPLALWPEARSAIALGMNYAPASNPLALAAHPELGRISVYAQGGDYHKTVKKALKALARFIVDEAPSELKVFVDTAPVMEKPIAQAAGIGWQGKHTNLVSRDHGSWLFLGVILTSLELQPDRPTDHGLHCGSCTRCLDACPTQAFIGAHRIDARRCISYLTIEHEGSIPDELRTSADPLDQRQIGKSWNEKAVRSGGRIGARALDRLVGKRRIVVLRPSFQEKVGAGVDEEVAADPVSKSGNSRGLVGCLIEAIGSNDLILEVAPDRTGLREAPAVCREALGILSITALEIDCDRQIDAFCHPPRVRKREFQGDLLAVAKAVGHRDRSASRRDRLRARLRDGNGAPSVPGVEQHQWIAGNVGLRKIFELAHGG